MAGWKTPLFRKLGIVSLHQCGAGAGRRAVRAHARRRYRHFDLALIYFTIALPFLGSGIIVSLTISETIERVDKVYFFDLLGAAAGCLALVGLLETVGGPDTVVAVSVLFAAAAAIWFSLDGCKLGRVASVAVGLLFTMLVIAE